MIRAVANGRRRAEIALGIGSSPLEAEVNRLWRACVTNTSSLALCQSVAVPEFPRSWITVRTRYSTPFARPVCRSSRSAALQMAAGRPPPRPGSFEDAKRDPTRALTQDISRLSITCTSTRALQSEITSDTTLSESAPWSFGFRLSDAEYRCGAAYFARPSSSPWVSRRLLRSGGH